MTNKKCTGHFCQTCITAFLFIAVILSDCSFGPAPISDGLHLRYKLNTMGEECFFDLIFSKTGNGRFNIAVTVTSEYYSRDTFIKPHEKDGKIIVNKFMKRRNKKPLEIGEWGPLWIPPNKRKVGTNLGVDFTFSGTITDKTEKWKNWNVYAVAVTMLSGAISSTWYYEVKTGFLVGCVNTNLAIEMLGNQPPGLLLVGSNITGL